ncbi:MAG: hypothetical protein CFH19_01068 [Alphaproteobacteria bacterium MarineAlpha5_Bin9]|nr:MAG: hypothetical protein CFH19_01068 [Alphaproteobacteria bacterium MarineAlpha5_Bin9]|tara:strand:+ start:6997 stop:7536 length:540 start_codon:yes stop_codon:yes gene_type:complete
MKKILIILILFINFELLADQNDSRLNDLFQELKKSSNEQQINEITGKIWDIWLETNDVQIEKYFTQGLKYLNSNNYQLAIISFTKVININPNFAEAWNKRATVYYILGDFDSSVSDIEKTLKLEPRHFGALDGLALIFLSIQDYQNAYKIYDRILKIFPNNSNIIQKKNFALQKLSNSI